MNMWRACDTTQAWGGNPRCIPRSACTAGLSNGTAPRRCRFGPPEHQWSRPRPPHRRCGVVDAAIHSHGRGKRAGPAGIGLNPREAGPRRRVVQPAPLAPSTSVGARQCLGHLHCHQLARERRCAGRREHAVPLHETTPPSGCAMRRLHWTLRAAGRGHRVLSCGRCRRMLGQGLRVTITHRCGVCPARGNPESTGFRHRPVESCLGAFPATGT